MVRMPKMGTDMLMRAVFFQSRKAPRRKVTRKPAIQHISKRKDNLYHSLLNLPLFAGKVPNKFRNLNFND